MHRQDDFLQTVTAVHAAGLDEALWPEALRRITELFGSVGGTLEVIDKTIARHSDFWSHGLPPGSDVVYMNHYMAISPRMPLCRLQKQGDVGYDYLIIDEAGIRADAYYNEFLGRADMRYFVSATVAMTPGEVVLVSVQRSARQGHARKSEIATMDRLTPHLQQAFDLTRRLRKSERAFEQTLDWLHDGALLLDADGRVLHANRTAESLIRRNDVVHVVQRRLEFRQTDARARFDSALAGIQKLQSGDPLGGGSDFHVARPNGLPPYLVSVRPILGNAQRLAGLGAKPLAVLFIRDLAASDGVLHVPIAREMFGLTEAEASLADALARGTSPSAYAVARHLSLNTVYTHLRHLKAKVGARRMSELTGKLAELKAPLRSNGAGSRDLP
jgi:DNA-binding CsgD family transcriptional regulator/PAS domain-containing protein